MAIWHIERNISNHQSENDLNSHNYLHHIIFFPWRVVYHYTPSAFSWRLSSGLRPRRLLIGIVVRRIVASAPSTLGHRHASQNCCSGLANSRTVMFWVIHATQRLGIYSAWTPGQMEWLGHSAFNLWAKSKRCPSHLRHNGRLQSCISYRAIGVRNFFIPLCAYQN